jgi:predicted transcriptional regulator of viral defense system
MERDAGVKSEQCDRIRYTASLNLAIGAFVVGRHGIAGLGQLKDLGLGPRGSQLRAARGRLYRVQRGVYSVVPPALLSREGLWLAAVLSCGPDAVLSHRSAAALHGLRPNGATRIDIAVPRRLRQRPGLRIHKSATLTRADITIVSGIPCTTVARTLLDLASVLPRRALERACDQAEILQVFDLHAIEEQLRRHPRRAGTAKLRAILDEHYIGQTPTWSVLEEHFLALTRGAGLPDPEVNAFIDPGDGEPAVRVDFAWPERRLAVEADGRETHLTHQAFERDRRRDQRVTAAGWRVVRTTWRQIRVTPAELRQTLRTLYGLGAA